MSRHLTTKQKPIALNANSASVAWKAARFQCKNSPSVNNHWLWRCQDSYCALTSAVLAFMHGSYNLSYSLYTIYLYTAHMRVFMYLLSSVLFKRTPKIWIWSSVVVNEAVEALKTSDTFPCSQQMRSLLVATVKDSQASSNEMLKPWWSH